MADRDATTERIQEQHTETTAGHVGEASTANETARPLVVLTATQAEILNNAMGNKLKYVPLSQANAPTELSQEKQGQIFAVCPLIRSVYLVKRCCTVRSTRVCESCG
jgi:hypothetical protein